MNVIKARWVNGHIVPIEPVNWPEGSELLVEPMPAGERMGIDESEWRDDPEAIAGWLAWVETIAPMVLTEDERRENEGFAEEFRRVQGCGHVSDSRRNGRELD